MSPTRERVIFDTRRACTYCALLCVLLQGCGGAGSEGAAKMKYSVGGSITGLNNASGLVLINSGGDATTINANATSFTMNTYIAAGSVYSISVGTQPYGITVACSASNATGTATTDVTSVVISCSDVTPVQREIAFYFNSPTSIAVDPSGNLFVLDISDNKVKEIPLTSNGYGAPITLIAPDNTPAVYGAVSVAVDASDNLFLVSMSGTGIMEFPRSGSGYGSTIIIGSGKLVGPSSITADAAGNLYVSEQYGIAKFSPQDGTYVYVAQMGLTPTQIGFQPVTGPPGIAADRTGNVFVTNTGNGTVQEVPFTNGTFGAPVTIASGFSQPFGLAVDAADNVFVADSGNSTLSEIAFQSGVYAAPVALGSGFHNPTGVALDAAGNLFVADSGNELIKEVPLANGSFGTAIAMGSGFYAPQGIAVDAMGDLFVADTGNTTIKQLPFSNGVYGSAIAVSSGSGISPIAIAVDSAGNLFAGESTGVIVEIALSNRGYMSPAGIGFTTMPSALALDPGHNLVVADAGGPTGPDGEGPLDTGAIFKLAFNNGTYGGSPSGVGSGFLKPQGVAVDSSGNVFVADSANGAVKEVRLVNGAYGAPIALGTGFSNPQSIAVDATGNLFVADPGLNAVLELQVTNGAYGTPITLGSGFSLPSGVAVDSHGWLYILDSDAVWTLTP
jgi:sugar lactone lactonase YvrE